MSVHSTLASVHQCKLKVSTACLHECDCAVNFAVLVARTHLIETVELGADEFIYMFSRQCYFHLDHHDGVGVNSNEVDAYVLVIFAQILLCQHNC